MPEHGRKLGRTTFRSPWNLVQVLVGLLFVSVGASMIVFVVGVSSTIVGIGACALGLYPVVGGLRSGVVADESGLVIRQGLRSSRFVPWQEIASFEVVKDDYFLARLYVPVVWLVDSNKIDLRQLGYYRIVTDRESRRVKLLSDFISEYA